MLRHNFPLRVLHKSKNGILFFNSNMMKKPLTTKIAFSIVFISLISAFFAGALVIGAGLSQPDSQQKIYNLLSFVVGQSFMLLPLLYFLIIKKEPIIDRLRIRAIKKDVVFYTFLLSIGVVILSDELDRIVNIIWPAPDYILDLNNLLQPESTLGFILLVLAIVVIAPIGEELLFRGFLQQILEQSWNDTTRSILVTALVFAVIHMNAYWFIQIYFLGILLGFLAWKTKSVIPSLILHSVNNGLALTFAMTDINQYSLYIWNGHVAPWCIALCICFATIGFKKINHIK